MNWKVITGIILAVFWVISWGEPSANALEAQIVFVTQTVLFLAAAGFLVWGYYFTKDKKRKSK